MVYNNTSKAKIIPPNQISHLLIYPVVGIANMSSHGGLLSEGGATQRALIWPLPSMRVHVVFKVVLLVEHAATDTARVARRGWQGEESRSRALKEKQRPCS